MNSSYNPTPKPKFKMEHIKSTIAICIAGLGAMLNRTFGWTEQIHLTMNLNPLIQAALTGGIGAVSGWVCLGIGKRIWSWARNFKRHRKS